MECNVSDCAHMQRLHVSSVSNAVGTRTRLNWLVVCETNSKKPSCMNVCWLKFKLGCFSQEKTVGLSIHAHTTQKWWATETEKLNSLLVSKKQCPEVGFHNQIVFAVGTRFDWQVYLFGASAKELHIQRL